jgi:hypothetical protein
MAHYLHPHPWAQRVEAEALRLQSEMALALAEGRRAMDERVAQAFEEAQARATAAISERAGGCGGGGGGGGGGPPAAASDHRAEL